VLQTTRETEKKAELQLKKRRDTSQKKKANIPIQTRGQTSPFEGNRLNKTAEMKTLSLTRQDKRGKNRGKKAGGAEQESGTASLAIGNASRA